MFFSEYKLQKDVFQVVHKSVIFVHHSQNGYLNPAANTRCQKYHWLLKEPLSYIAGPGTAG